MKKTISIGLIAFTVLFTVACGDGNSTAAKSDSSTTSIDSSSEPKTGLATGTTNNANVPSPETATPDSGNKNKSMKDSTIMKKP